MRDTFRSLGNRNYRRYAAGGVVSNVGTWMHRIGQDWLVLQLTGGSAVALGITTGLQFLPFLLLSLTAGAVADRVSKVRLLQATNLAMALPAVVLGLLAVTGRAEVWQVYALALLSGTAAAFDAPARQSFVPELVSDHDLPNAVGLNGASFNLARLIGPGLAGLLIAVLGGGAEAAGWVLLINSASYLAPILALRRIEADLGPGTTSSASSRGRIREGLRYVAGRRDLLLVMAIMGWAATFGLNFQMTAALMSTQVFGKGPTEFGLLGTFLALGSLTGALLAAGRTTSRRRTLVLAALAFGAADVVAGLMPTYTAYALVTPLIGLTAMTMINAASTYLQVHSDPLLRGRVTALYMVVFLGGTPLGSPIVGWVGEVYGGRWTLIAGGAITIVGVLLSVLVIHGTDYRAGAGRSVLELERRSE
ncbi:MAG: MFS transporter [Nocardioides sp.]